MLYEKLLPAAPESTPSDPYFKNVSMLLPGDVNQSLTYTAFSDASTNNFLLTPFGDTYGTPFSPYNTSWSVGNFSSSNYVTFPYTGSGPLDLTSGDFTVEAWIYVTTATGTQQTIFTTGLSTSTSYATIRFHVFNGGLRLLMQDSVSNDWQNTSNYGTVNPNAWNHVAAVRNGSSIKVYVNGTGYDIATYSGTYVQAGTVSGAGNTQNYSLPLQGNITNLRVLKGVAAYTGDFTPPSLASLSTSGSASAAAYPSTTNVNTSFSASACSLLTCMSNRFIDLSPNALTVTAAGSPYIQAFSPFTDTDTTTGSGYFDGSGDYLSTAYNINWSTLGTYTLEFWVYHTSLSPVNQAYLSTGGSGYTNFYCYANGRVGLGIQGTNEIVTASGAVSVNTWTHIAYTFDGTTTKIYINGVQAASGTTAVYSNNTAALQIANGLGGLPVYGYMSNLRIVLGSALTSFNLTSPLTAVSGTSLLTLQTRGAVQNIGFIDSSPNRFPITKVGNTTQGTFSPYGNLWSNYFDGSGDYLSRAFTSTTDGMYLQGTTYTIEAWIYMTSTSGIQEIYCCSAANVGSFGTVNLYVNSGVLGFNTRPTTGGGESGTTGGSIIANTWNHVSASVSAGSARLFLNGTQVGSTTTVSAALFTPVGAAIGRIPNGYTLGITDFTGYVSNLRIVQGQALYTSNFTPSTTPLTAVSNTSLLTCQSNRFIDNSSNNFTLTANGTPSVQRFSPFNPTTAYSASTIGGSGYFDGTGDYLTLPPNASLRQDQGNWTLEAFVYINSLAANNTIATCGTYLSQYSFYYGVQTTGALYCEMGTGGWATSATYTSSTGAARINQWNHIAFVREGTAFSMYANGVRVFNQASASFGVNALGTFWIGSYFNVSANLNGYLNGLRFVQGTALYSGTTYTVPTAPLTAISGTSLLCNFTNAGVWDAAMMNDIAAVGNARIVTTVKKYNTGSMYFDGSGGHLLSNVASNDLYTFGSGNFTVEFWLYLNATQTSVVYDQRPYGTSGIYPLIYVNSNVIIYDVNATPRITGATLSSLTWYHIAVSRSGTSTKLFVNGTQSGATYTDSNSYLNAPQKPIIGVSAYLLDYPLNGYIDDLRVTKGVARYTANFTPPTAALPLY